MSPPSPADLRHFEALYAASDDPWQVRESWYERRKRDVLLACLDRPRYAHAFEPGCGNGEMSVALAARCDRLLAVDGSPSALAAARQRLRHADGGAGGVVFAEAALPGGWPRGACFDLVVISELGYYLDGAALRTMFDSAGASLEPGGELVLCHYLPDFDDRVSATEAVHAAAAATPGLTRVFRHREPAFLLEAWRMAGAGQERNA
jgi:SAM-dependent methyltransferase